MGEAVGGAGERRLEVVEGWGEDEGARTNAARADERRSDNRARSRG